jgi:hypothetical protein
MPDFRQWARMRRAVNGVFPYVYFLLYAVDSRGKVAQIPAYIVIFIDDFFGN